MAPLVYCPFRPGWADGAVAQLGERRNRTAEVRGSNPLGSTSFRKLKPQSPLRPAAGGEPAKAAHCSHARPAQQVDGSTRTRVTVTYRACQLTRSGGQM